MEFLFKATPLRCELHRFSIDAKKNEPDEWYVVFSGSFPAGQPYLCCIYGSWSEGSKLEYKSWKDAPNTDAIFDTVDGNRYQFPDLMICREKFSQLLKEGQYDESKTNDCQ